MNSTSKVELLGPIDRGYQFTYSALGASDDLSAGDVILLGSNLLAIVVEEAAGATVRAASIAAGAVPKPALCALLLSHELVSVMKTLALAIAKGDKLYWDVAEQKVNTSPLGNIFFGYCTKAAANPSSTVEGTFGGFCSGGLVVPTELSIPLTSVTLEDGTALTKQATTAAGFLQVGNKEVVIDIPVNCASEPLQVTVATPADIDITKDMTLKVLISKAADLDALTMDCEAFMCSAGDLQNSDIQDTAATAIVAAGTVLSFVCGADGILAPPSSITFVLLLGGTNDGDATYIHSLTLEYTSIDKA